MASAIRLPQGLVCYRRTPTFDQDSVPAGLLAEHRLKPGTWGRIVVVSGELDYVLSGEPATVVRLNGGTQGAIEPSVPHHLELVGPVEFLVEFLRAPPDPASG